MEIRTNGFGGQTFEALNALYVSRRRPGRPSPEQRELKTLLDIMQSKGLTKLPKNGLVIEDVPEETDEAGAETPEMVTMDPQTDPVPVRKPKGKPGAKKEEHHVEIPSITIGTIEATVEGTEILIMHAWDVKSKRQIAEKQQKKAPRQREARDPQAEFEAARYIDSKKRDCVPARCFKNAIVEAATFVNDVTKKLIKGSIYVKGDLLPIVDRNGKPIAGTLREDMVRIGGMSKVADIRYRPEYPVGWRIPLSIEYDTAQFSPVQVVALLDRAGFNVGVGEWRPTFGRFRVMASKK